MLKLIKKEILLCLHPTSFIFLSFALLIFVPNYPYEVIFFFSCLSVYFSCIMSRENGDIAFTCALPVKKSVIPLAKILTAVGLQCILLLLTGIAGAVKGAVFPVEIFINQAGLSANIAMLGNCDIGTFNIIFFPLYFKSPEKIGAPFIISSIFMFLLISLFIILRWTTPLFSKTLNGLNTENTLAKSAMFLTGFGAYIVLTAIGCKASMNAFQKVDV